MATSPRCSRSPVREDASTRDREKGDALGGGAWRPTYGGFWVDEVGRSAASTSVCVSRAGLVRFESRVVEVDVADGGYRGHRAMRGVCRRRVEAPPRCLAVDSRRRMTPGIRAWR